MAECGNGAAEGFERACVARATSVACQSQAATNNNISLSQSQGLGLNITPL